MDEKTSIPLPLNITQNSQQSSAPRVYKKGAVLLASCLLLLGFDHVWGRGASFGSGCKFSGLLHRKLATFGHKEAPQDVCPQAGSLEPSTNNGLWTALGDTYRTEAFKGKAIEWLGGAVRVPTESFDRMGPIDEDPRWQAFKPFHEYLLTAFPMVHTTLELTKVNTFGLVYEWKGTNSSLKPLLLAAHQDVVPVDPRTVDEWAHPPFSGFFDGERIWGRGSSDDKSGLIGIMSSIETLLQNGFQPTRSVVLAFGFDEEASGVYGAQTLAKALLSKFGKNAFAMLVDEGGGFSEQYGGIFAVPAVAEKGALDVRVEVSAPGGHSSVPPLHTSIGMLAALLVQYESNPYEVHLERASPMYSVAQCLAAFAPDVPASLRKAIKDSLHSDSALKDAEGILLQDKLMKSFIGTTQAIDLIQGGVKSNALPEQAWGVVNHRIATTSSLDAIKEHDTVLLKSIAEQFDLSYTAFGKEIAPHTSSSAGSLVLSDAWGTGLQPAPITPSGKAAPFQLLSGTIKATYHAHRAGEDNVREINIAPGIMSGNTDTRYYWDLTEHIFRYNHHNSINASRQFPGPGVHTVNESIELDAFLEMIRFFTTLILNVDESTAI